MIDTVVKVDATATGWAEIKPTLGGLSKWIITLDLYRCVGDTIIVPIIFVSIDRVHENHLLV